MTFVLGVAAGIFGMIGLLVLLGAALDAAHWWKDRERRRWPRQAEWDSLMRVVISAPYPNPEERKRANLAYRKLRYKYGKKVYR